jgi:imidazolonepropionase-like amidohydrolase
VIGEKIMEVGGKELLSQITNEDKVIDLSTHTVLPGLIGMIHFLQFVKEIADCVF